MKTAGLPQQVDVFVRNILEKSAPDSVDELCRPRSVLQIVTVILATGIMKVCKQSKLNNNPQLSNNDYLCIWEP